ncbi:MAG: hypothetical protein ACKPKO_39105 [Candidatus Fonsibacter sp.]
MTGWLEYAIFIGATTAVTIIVKKLKCKYNENAHRGDYRGGDKEGIAIPYKKIITM